MGDLEEDGSLLLGECLAVGFVDEDDFDIRLWCGGSLSLPVVGVRV